MRRLAGEHCRGVRLSVLSSFSSLILDSSGLAPLPFLGMDGNYYLIAMFNESVADHHNRVCNMAEDPLIESARVCMGVDKDPSLEATLQWFRWPLDWLGIEERQKDWARPAEEDAKGAEEIGKTRPMRHCHKSVYLNIHRILTSTENIVICIPLRTDLPNDEVDLSRHSNIIILYLQMTGVPLFNTIFKADNDFDQ